jgi:hypothetical protein
MAVEGVRERGREKEREGGGERREALCGMLREAEGALMEFQTRPSWEYSVEEREAREFRRRAWYLLDLVRTLEKVARCGVR